MQQAAVTEVTRPFPSLAEQGHSKVVRSEDEQGMIWGPHYLYMGQSYYMLGLASTTEPYIENIRHKKVQKQE